MLASTTKNRCASVHRMRKTATEPLLSYFFFLRFSFRGSLISRAVLYGIIKSIHFIDLRARFFPHIKSSEIPFLFFCYFRPCCSLSHSFNGLCAYAEQIMARNTATDEWKCDYACAVWKNSASLRLKGKCNRSNKSFVQHGTVLCVAYPCPRVCVYRVYV